MLYPAVFRIGQTAPVKIRLSHPALAHQQPPYCHWDDDGEAFLLALENTKPTPERAMAPKGM
jgi:hypothetical protein